MIDINDTSIEEEEKQDQQIAQLQQLSAEEQAHSQLDPVISPVTEGSSIPEGQFEGQGGPGTTTSVDLSDKGSKDKMWEEYREWYMLGREGRRNPFNPYGKSTQEQTDVREALRDQWFLKYYGMDYETNQAREAENREKYGNPLNQFRDTMRGLTDISMGASSDWVMDAIGVLPGLGPLDDFYDRRTKSPNSFHQKLRSMLSIVVPSIISGN